MQYALSFYLDQQNKIRRERRKCARDGDSTRYINGAVDGRSSHSLYRTWYLITSNHRKDQKQYEVCERWLKNFWFFVADIGDRPEGFEFARINKDAPFNKKNCRWVESSK